MQSLVELTAEIVSAHAGTCQMTSDEMLLEIQKVHAALKALETGSVAVEVAPAVEPPKQLTLKQAFKKDAVVCMICGKSFTTLKRHLSQAHDMMPGQYRKQFNIPAGMPLAAKNYSEARRQAAHERGLADVLAKAREKRAAAKKGVPAKTSGAQKPKGKAPSKKG